MPFDGSGSFLRVHNWVADAAGGIKILASRHDAEDQNLASGLSQCITKDGQTSITADISWNSKKLTNLAAPTAPTDAATKAYVDTAAAASVYTPPIGAGMEFWGPTPPPKWVLAFGQPLSRVTYSALFAVLGTNFGAGDGSTTFNMPDVRGRVVAGVDYMGGVSANRLPGYVFGAAGVGGSDRHGLVLSEIPAHQHSTTITVSGNTGGRSAAHSHTVPGFILNGTGAVTTAGHNTAGSGPLANSEQTLGETQDHVHFFSASGTGTSSTSGGSLFHNNTQPTIVAQYIIYAGV